VFFIFSRYYQISIKCQEEKFARDGCITKVVVISKVIAFSLTPLSSIPLISQNVKLLTEEEEDLIDLIAQDLVQDLEQEDPIVLTFQEKEVDREVDRQDHRQDHRQDGIQDPDRHLQPLHQKEEEILLISLMRKVVKLGDQTIIVTRNAIAKIFKSS